MPCPASSGVSAVHSVAPRKNSARTLYNAIIIKVETGKKQTAAAAAALSDVFLQYQDTAVVFILV